MKIILISDLHFPKLTSQKSNPFKYQNTVENNFNVNRLIELAHEINKRIPDEVYILGDLLDSININLCTIEVLKNFIDSIHCTVSYINGNHERINQNDYILDFIDLNWSPLQKHFNIFNTTFIALNHNEIHEAMYNTSDILLSHFRWSLPVFWGKQGELSKSSLETITKNYSDCILGDIHSEYSPEDNVTYINQPYSHKYLPESPKGFIELDVDEDGYEITRHHLDLANKILINCNFKELEDVLSNLDKRHLYKIRINLTSDEVEFLPIPNNRVKFDLVIQGQELTEVMVVEKENVLGTLLSVIPLDNREYIEEILR